MRNISCESFFCNVLPTHGYSLRKPQLILSGKIQEAIESNKVFVAEAEVGTGKTFAYLYPALLYHINTGKRVLISTKTIALQEQLVYKDLPIMISMIKAATEYDREITYSIRKGKHNYICENKLAKYAMNSNIKGIESIIHNYNENQIFDRKRFSINICEKDWEKISAGDCVKSKCKNRLCLYRMFKDNNNSDILVCNHSYVFSCLMDKRNPLLDDASILIFDEAHNLEETAYDKFGGKLQLSQFVILLSKNDMENDISSINALSYSKKLFYLLYNNTIFPEVELNEEFKVDVNDEIQDTAQSLYDELNELSNKYNIKASMVNDKRLSSKIENTSREIDLLMEILRKIYSPSDFIWWTSRIGKDNVVLHFTSKNISEQLTNILFSKPVPIILTSGTMAAHLHEDDIENDFDYFESSIGILDIKANRHMAPIQIKSDFDYKNHGILYIENSIPFVRMNDVSKREEYLIRLSERIKQIIRYSSGRTLILFTSKREMRVTYQRIKDEIETTFGFNCYLHDGGQGTFRAKEKFEEDISSCLFSASFWEGIDIKGPSLSTVIIHKLPYPSPSPSFNYRESVLSNQTENGLRDMEMLTKLRQGAGRLIRDKNDTGVLAILDSRANLVDRLNVIISNLPPFKKITNIADIYEFFNGNKKIG